MFRYAPRVICTLACHEASLFIYDSGDDTSLTSPNITVRDVRRAMSAYHDRQCSCGYKLGDAWATSLEMSSMTETDMIKFPVDAPSCSRLINQFAYIEDNFPHFSPKKVQIVFCKSSSPSFIELGKKNVSKKRLPEDGHDSAYASDFSSPSSSSFSFKRPRYSRALNVHGSVFQLDDKTVKQLFPTLRSIKSFSRQSGALLVDKSPAIVCIDDCFSQRLIPVVRRPPGFGLRTFRSMIAFMYDCHQGNDPEVFSSLATGIHSWTPKTGRTHKCAILRLDFASPAIDRNNLQQSLLSYVKDRLDFFSERYALLIAKCDPVPYYEGIYCFRTVLCSFFYNFARNSTLPLLIIENYDVLADCDATRSPTGHPSSLIGSFLSELAYWVRHGKVLAGVLLMSYLDDIAGPHSIKASPPYMDCMSRDAIDLSTHPALQSAFGFTEQEILDLEEATKELRSPDATPIMDVLRDRQILSRTFSRPQPWGDAWWQDPVYSNFPRLPEVPVYPMNTVLDLLAQ